MTSLDEHHKDLANSTSYSMLIPLEKHEPITENAFEGNQRKPGYFRSGFRKCRARASSVFGPTSSKQDYVLLHNSKDADSYTSFPSVYCPECKGVFAALLCFPCGVCCCLRSARDHCPSCGCDIIGSTSSDSTQMQHGYGFKGNGYAKPANHKSSISAGNSTSSLDSNTFLTGKQ